MKFFRIVGNDPKVIISNLFLTRPTAELYLREIAAKTKLSIGAVFKHAAELNMSGILLKEKKGRQEFYRLNRTSVIVKALKRLHTVSSDAIESAVTVLKTKDIRRIILFGSAARGEDVEESDLDLLVVGDASPVEIAVLAKRLSAMHKRKFSIVIRTPEQYIDMPKHEEVLWRRLEQDKVILYEV